MAPKGRSAASSTRSAAAPSEPMPTGEIAAASAGGEERRKMATSKEAGGSRRVPASRGNSSSVRGRRGASFPSSGRAMTGEVGGGMAAATTGGEKSTSLRHQVTAPSSPRVGMAAAGREKASSLRGQVASSSSRAGMAAAVPGREKGSSLRGQVASSSPRAGMAAAVPGREKGSSLQGQVASSSGAMPRREKASSLRASSSPRENPSSLGDQGGTSSPGPSPAAVESTGASAIEQGNGEGVGRGKSSFVPALGPSLPEQTELARVGRASSSGGRHGESSARGGRASSSGVGWSDDALPQKVRCCVGRILTMKNKVDFKRLQSVESPLSWINSSGTCALFAQGYAVTARHCVTDEDYIEGRQQVLNEEIEAVPNDGEEVWIAYFPCYNSTGKPRPKAFKFYVVNEDANLDVAILYLEGCNNTTYMQPITTFMQNQLLGKKVHIASFLRLVDLSFEQNGEDPLLMTIPPFISSFVVASPSAGFTFVGDYFCQANASGSPIFFYNEGAEECWLVGVHTDNFYGNIAEKLKPDFLDVPNTLQDRTLKCQLLYPWIVDKVKCSKELGVFAPIRRVITETGFEL